MEGSGGGFLKRLRAARQEGELAAQEAAAEKQREIEKAIPAPPAMGEGDAEAFKTAVEEAILDQVVLEPKTTRVYINLVEYQQARDHNGRVLSLIVPSQKWFSKDTNNTWWSSVCNWARKLLLPGEDAHYEYYKVLLKKCFQHARDACAGCDAKMELLDSGMLIFTIP